MQVSYKVVQTVEGQLVATCPTSIVAWAEVSERALYWPGINLRLRPELQLQPKIQGFCGPMFDGYDANGLPVVRYEDQASYNTLSA
jgi:hypothetical protein